MSASRLPQVIVIGAMKCATSAVHAYLDAHPHISMAPQKEVNFFNGPATPPPTPPDEWWRTGQWHRGLEWYVEQLGGPAPVRGESSPAYTSPSFPEVPSRMASVVPDVRLVYLVRDPFERALSQYHHHRRDGGERRPADAALLDPGSQYLTRSRYAERLQPFLEHFPREQVHVVLQERLLASRRREVEALHRHVGVEPWWDPDAHGRRHHEGAGHRPAPYGDDRPLLRLRDRFAEAVDDDVQRLRELLGDDLSEWSCVRTARQGVG